MTDIAESRAGTVIPLFVGGRWETVGRKRAVANPYTGKHVATVIEADEMTVDSAVNNAFDANRFWADMPAYRRAEILERAAQALDTRREEAARTVAEQMGKALRQAIVEVDRAVLTLHLSSQEATRIAGEVQPADAISGGEGVLAYWVRRPLGVIAAITPFNAPVNLACHKVGPALAAGNVVVWKTPPQVPGVGPILAETFQEAGLPSGVLQVLHGGANIGAALVRHPRVSGISFTGSVQAGHAVRSEAGLKPTLLELGGIGINIIHRDADVGRAARACVAGAYKNSGQSCNSVQRVFLHRSIWDETLALLTEETRAQVVGDPLLPATDVGPVVSAEAADRIRHWLDEAMQAGARIVTGGEIEGALVTPTIVTDVPPTARIACEEVFGPMMTVEPYTDLAEVYAVADALPVGLTHSIFTSSLSVALEAARCLPSGTVNVNRNSNARLDQLPFGGVRASGLGGREGPRYAIEAMTAMRLVVLDPGT